MPHRLKRHLVAVIGAGPIGVGWAIVFARAGARVRLFDTSESALASASEQLRNLVDPSTTGFSTTDLHRIELEAAFERAVSDADHVQESIPERLEIKRRLFADLCAAAPSDSTLATSSSSLPISRIVDGLPCADRCIVAHPINPPYLIPVVEVVMGSQTSAATERRTIQLMTKAEMAVVRCKQEVLGFVINRLQFALLREALALAREGVADPGDIDRVITEGLAPRWVTTGPLALEAVLNGEDGFARYQTMIESVMNDLDGSSRTLDEDDYEVMRAAAEPFLWHGTFEGIIQKRDATIRALSAWKKARDVPLG